MPATRRRQVTTRRARRALDSARMLDQMVADHLPVMARLPEASRRRVADFLAELVLLSQAYRHHAAGWISRRELQRRGEGHVSRIAVIRRRSSLSSAQFTDHD